MGYLDKIGLVIDEKILVGQLISLPLCSVQCTLETSFGIQLRSTDHICHRRSWKIQAGTLGIAHQVYPKAPSTQDAVNVAAT